MDDRWFRVASGSLEEIGASLDAAIGTRSDVRLAVIFAPTSAALAQVATLVRDAAPGVQTVGMTAPSHLTRRPDAPPCTVALIGGSAVAVAVSSAATAADRRGAGRSVASCIDRVPAGAGRVLLLLSDRDVGNQVDVVAGAHDAVGSDVTVAGGCAVPGPDGDHRCLLHGEELLGAAVVAVAISSSGPIGMGVDHGFEPTGVAMLATQADGCTVLALDGQPALDVYLRAYGAPAGLENDPTAFAEFSETRPLGWVRRGRSELRFIAGCEPDRRALTTVAEVPVGAVVWPMAGSAESVAQSAAKSVTQAVQELDGHEPIGALLFDCVGLRSLRAGNGTDAMLDALAATLDGAPHAGAYTLGEIGRRWGAGGFHNQSLVSVVFG